MSNAIEPTSEQPNGPYLDAALICEQIIKERDGTYSAIRLVNRLTAHDAEVTPGSILQTPLRLLVSFKSGSFHGDKDLLIRVHDPSGQIYEPFMPMKVKFLVGDGGPIADCPLFFRYDRAGVYWIEIVLGDTSFSRIPLSFSFGPEKTPN